MITIVTCVAINSTLPILLRLAKCYDYQKLPKTPIDPEVSSDDESESDNEENDSSNPRKVGHPPKPPSSRNASSVASDSQHLMTSSSVGSPVNSVIMEARPRKAQNSGPSKRQRRRKQRERDIRLAVGMQKLDSALSKEDIDETLPLDAGVSASGSVMSKLSLNGVSMDDGFTENEINVHGRDPLYERRSCREVIFEVSEWDSSLASLATSYMMQALAEKIAALAELAVIGQAIGVTEANAFLMVNFLFEVTDVFVVGFQEGKNEASRSRINQTQYSSYF